MELMCDRVAIIQNGKLIDVRLIKEYIKEGDKSKVVFEVNDKELAIRVLATSPFTAKTVNEGLEFAIDRDQIAELNSLLVYGGVKVYSIKAITQTLEDKFLEMTGSDQIA
ncbi:unnamed protein product [Aphanomyces euteiches]